jgi:hypothetical protein
MLTKRNLFVLFCFVCLFSAGGLPAVFHNVDGFDHDFQLDGHDQSGNTSTGQSGLLHLFPDRVGQPTGRLYYINLSTNYHFSLSGFYFTFFFFIL